MTLGTPNGHEAVSFTPCITARGGAARETTPLTPEQRAALLRLAAVLKQIAARRLANRPEQEARHAG